MLNVPVPQVVLNRPRVVSLVGELVADRMPEHVRVDREGKFRLLARSGDELTDT